MRRSFISERAEPVRDGQSLGARNELKWRMLLRETVEALLAEAEAETTADEDQRALERAASGTHAGTPGGITPGGKGAGAGGVRPGARSERRRRAAIITRLGEKRLLRSVLGDLNAALAEMAPRKCVGPGCGSAEDGGGSTTDDDGGKQEGQKRTDNES